MTRALITGITGQDGSYLAEFLLAKGYEVCAFTRRESWFRPNNVSHLSARIEAYFGDMIDGVDIATAVQESRPDEIYNLASQSRPGESWARASETLMINGLAATRLFEAVRHVCPGCRVYHASSSEMFGLWPRSDRTSTRRSTRRTPTLRQRYMRIRWRASIAKVMGCSLPRGFCSIMKVNVGHCIL